MLEERQNCSGRESSSCWWTQVLWYPFPGFPSHPQTPTQNYVVGVRKMLTSPKMYTECKGTCTDSYMNIAFNRLKIGIFLYIPTYIFR